MTLKDDLIIIKTKCGQIALGNGSCYCCGAKTARRGMTIHHVWYINNDVIYKDFPANDTGRLAYYTALLPMIIRNPKRFMYLCNTCHQALERMCRFGDKKFNKLCQMRKMTLSHKAKIYIEK